MKSLVLVTATSALNRSRASKLPSIIPGVRDGVCSTTTVRTPTCTEDSRTDSSPKVRMEGWLQPRDRLFRKLQETSAHQNGLGQAARAFAAWPPNETLRVRTHCRSQRQSRRQRRIRRTPPHTGATAAIEPNGEKSSAAPGVRAAVLSIVTERKPASRVPSPSQSPTVPPQENRHR